MSTSCEELTHWKRPWCWEGLGAGGEGDDRGWDGWMASPTRWAWVWVNSGSLWWTGRPDVLWFMGSQRVGHYWATELNWTDICENKCCNVNNIYAFFFHLVLSKMLLFQRTAFDHMVGLKVRENVPRSRGPELRPLASLRGQTPGWMISSSVRSIIKRLMVGLVVIYDL